MAEEGVEDDGRRLSELFAPRVEVPGEHRDIERMAAAGQYAAAAEAIADLRIRSLLDQNRAVLAEAACWIRAGRPRTALDVLGAGRRTIATAWCQACALVSMGRLNAAAQQVLWVGERIPLLGDERLAARALFAAIDMAPPSWLVDPEYPARRGGGPGRQLPPPYLAGFFYPDRPDVPPGFEDVADEIQRDRYESAARRLIARRVTEPSLSRKLAVATAACWLLADEPEAAEAWLQHRPAPAGIWALACARVQQNHLEAALEPLARLARQGSLDEDWRGAAAALVAHLGLTSPPSGLEVLAGHPCLDLARAQEEGCSRFVDRIVRKIDRQASPEAVSGIVERVAIHCASGPEDEARKILVPMYEAAVRVSADPTAFAARGLRLLMSRPDGMPRDDTEHSRMLLFATACDCLEALRSELHEQAGGATDPEALFSCWLAVAKLCLVQDDRRGVVDHARKAAAAAVSAESRARATRLERVPRWLTLADSPTISQWQLRQLHHLLPRDTAELLEGRRPWPDRQLDRTRAAPATELHVAAAARYLQEATAIAKDSSAGLEPLRTALGAWALNAGLAILASGPEGAPAAVTSTGAAWRLLGPNPPREVVEAHARAIGMACAEVTDEQRVLDVVARHPLSGDTRVPADFGLAVLAAWRAARSAARNGAGQAPTPDLERLLGPAAPPPARPSLAAVEELLGGLDDVPPEVRATIELCVGERQALLPDAPPFRGRCWFKSDLAHDRYQAGRELWGTAEARDAHKAFEEAWIEEPHNYVTTQGLVFGLTPRVRKKPSRTHVLDYVARYLDQLAHWELEAALAYTRLSEVVDGERDRQFYLDAAATALQRRRRRTPWERAYNAEIAIRLELGNVIAAGEAAWEAALGYLPGSDTGTAYSLLAATLWSRAEARDRALRDQIRQALRLARQPRLTNREAVRYAVEQGQLIALSDLTLDSDALEDLWRACRGDEDDLCRFLEKLGGSKLSPRPQYLLFLAAKLEQRDRVGAARIRNRYLDDGASTSEPKGMPWLRLAAAELLARDPLTEVATPRDRLCQPAMRDFLACLRLCAGEDEVAYTAFHAVVEDALAALFDLRGVTPVGGAEPYGGRLAKAAEALETVKRSVGRFSSLPVASMATLLWHYLSLALNEPTVDAYMREKEKRLVPSRLGGSLGAWWSRLTRHAGSLDFFHHHQSYRLPEGAGPEDLPGWWASHRVQGKPVRQAVEELVSELDTHARQLADIERRYRSGRRVRDLGAAGFGLAADFEACRRALLAALAPDACPDTVRAMEPALERLSTALRGIDMARFVDEPDVFHDSSLPVGQYILPRAAELLGHWRRNVPGGPCLQAMFEVADDSGREVMCVMCMDRDGQPVPERTPLRGLSQFADLVEALGGQLHLWVTRPGDGSGCRREHSDAAHCAAEEYVGRIEDQLRHLATHRWRSQQGQLQPWLRTLNEALAGRGPAALAFAILPRMME
jgi:hypothetical protein